MALFGAGGQRVFTLTLSRQSFIDMKALWERSWG